MEDARSRRLTGDEITTLVVAARDGDRRAWDTLVRRLSGVVWAELHSVGLPVHQLNDAYQETWLKLLTNIGRIEQPASLPGWLMTTARREALNLIQRSRRFVPIPDVEPPATIDVSSDELLRSELVPRVAAGLALVPERCQRLLPLVAADVRPDYKVLQELLSLPHGSIGPTRQRCLELLRKTPPMRKYLESGRG